MFFLNKVKQIYKIYIHNKLKNISRKLIRWTENYKMDQLFSMFTKFSE